MDGDSIRYVGEADYFRKRELLSEARCLLAPITWEEPFGLFMIEAQACGTPVVALGRGAAPEVVWHGETGFVVDTVDDMVGAVGQVGSIDPRQCREWVEARFDVPRMADQYVDAYLGILTVDANKETTAAKGLLPRTLELDVTNQTRPVHNASQVMSLLADLSQAQGTAFLVVTHDLSMLQHFDRVLHLEGGRLVQGAG